MQYKPATPDLIGKPLLTQILLFALYDCLPEYMLFCLAETARGVHSVLNQAYNYVIELFYSKVVHGIKPGMLLLPVALITHGSQIA